MPVTDSSELSCWRCGAGLARLSLPITRRDMCPECASEIHACRMCVHYDPGVPRQCREDDAEDVFEKERLNFCDWFVPRKDAFDAAAKAEADRSRQVLDALFGDGDTEPEATDSALDDAEKLFR